MFGCPLSGHAIGRGGRMDRPAAGHRGPAQAGSRPVWRPVTGRWAVLAAVLVLSLLGPRSGHALDLGLTHGQVFSLWTNINASLLEFAEVVTDDEDWRDRLAAMPPRGFTGKSPADVLAQVKRYRTKLDWLRARAALTRTQQMPQDQAKITPSDVYMTSFEVLHAQLELLIRNTGPEQLVSQFYVRHEVSEKTPSHVFALVELACRRLERILTKVADSHDPSG